MHYWVRYGWGVHAGLSCGLGPSKIQFCVHGVKRLLDWCMDEKPSVLEYAKVITPQ